jgi:protein-tyrosine phosphatase
MIDLHCHILPAMDDGAASMAAALTMARTAWADGIRQVVATPHVQGFTPTPLDIRQAVSLFAERLAKEGIDLEVLPGADASALLPVELLRQHGINGGPYILFEFPHSYLPSRAGELVFAALVAGLKPIITHPERHPAFIAEPMLLLRMVAAGALAQVTAASLVGAFGPDAQACAAFLLRRGGVHFLASDAHSPDHRPPLLTEGLAAATRLIGHKAALRLVTTNPAAVLAGASIDD